MSMRVLEVQALSDDLSGLALTDRPVPRPGPGEVLVRIEASAIGFPDLLMTRGLYQAKPPLPFVPGMECAGVIVELGADVADWHAGDRVICGAATGGVAQYGVFGADAVQRLPECLSFAQGAALRIAYLTAWVALVRAGAAQAGEWLVVHGAAGGVGLAAVDLARALDLRTIAVASHPDKINAVQALYQPTALLGPVGIRDAVRDLTGGHGADLVFDPVGGDMFDISCRMMAFGGRLLVVGFASGRIPTLGANIALIKGFSVHGVRAGEYGRQFPAKGRENLAAIDALASAGRICPHVHSTVRMAEWRAAYTAMADRRVIGRTVILPHA